VRLLHVVPSYLPAWRHGGPIRSVHGLCAALARRGHEVTVFTTDTDIGPELPRAAPVERDGVMVWYFPTAAPRRLYRSPALGRALKKRIGSFDLVHLHSVFLWPTAAAAHAARAAGVPYVVAPRGMLVRDLLVRRGRLRKTLWIRFVERRNLAHAAALHVTSELEAADAAALDLPLPPLLLVPNGVDDEPDQSDAMLRPEVAAALTRQPLVLFLGRLSWKKGLDRLIAALTHSPTATLALAGGDQEAIRPRLEELARVAGVASRVLFLGEVAGADRVALLHRSAVLALTSYSENFGNSALEAMAAGIPVVVTEEVGLAAEVQRSGAGVVASGEPAALGAALSDLLADPVTRAAMGRAGREAVAARYGWDGVASAMEEGYAASLRRAPPRVLPSPRSDLARP
jgi:glycosyltransferase involved in cell wall biosynthesis